MESERFGDDEVWRRMSSAFQKMLIGKQKTPHLRGFLI
ncbi:hypothetical protein B4129_1207 [Bacillus safensis]|nr:hypothetical protein B4129_1207 [Bacillus safensis]